MQTRDFFYGLKNKFEIAVVNEPSVFELLKFCCILYLKLNSYSFLSILVMQKDTWMTGNAKNALEKTRVNCQQKKQNRKREQILLWQEMYQFYLKSSTINGNVNTVYILTIWVRLTKINNVVS